MRTFLIFACAIWSLSAISDEELWEEFKVKYKRNFKSIIQEGSRFQVFQKNLRKIEEHNAKYERGEVSYKLGVNKFTDRTQKKFKRYLNYYQQFIKSEVEAAFSSSDIEGLPNETDWRAKGAVTEVKDQGDCAACWAFAATGSLESRNFLLTGELLTLSEQYLIDCNSHSNHSNHGCDGGLVINAFRYIMESGIEPEEAYPYEGTDGICRTNGTLLKDLLGFVVVQPAEDKLKAAVGSVAPVVVSVDATYMKLYSEGVYDDPRCKNDFTNHVVLVVGYGTTSDGIDYWLVKNSWGADWGEDGYIRMIRNKDNQCGIANTPVYPII